MELVEGFQQTAEGLEKLVLEMKPRLLSMSTQRIKGLRRWLEPTSLPDLRMEQELKFLLEMLPMDKLQLEGEGVLSIDYVSISINRGHWRSIFLS